MPTVTVVPRAVEGFLEELWAFHALFYDCFARSEPRAHCFDYRVGHLRQRDRQSIEPMALHVEGSPGRGLQRFLSEVQWDEEPRLWHYHLVAEERGEPDGVLRFEEPSCVTKGQDSVGVARQYCGPLGQGENWQVGVFAAYASGPGSPLVAKRWCLPAVGWTAASAARRARCKVPKALALQSTPQLAAALLQRSAHAKLLPFQSVVAECLYGQSPDLLAAVDTGSGGPTFVAMPADTRCGLQAPRTTEQPSRYQGAVRATRVGVAEKAPCPVAAVAASLPASHWERRQGAEGTKGAIVYALARQGVTWGKEGLPERAGGLVSTRTVETEPA